MKKTLLILAAGMGSRFGGLKQIESMGPNGEYIIDYSVYDALKYGFNKIVFLIKEENYKIFKETIGKRVEPYVETEYVFQKNDNLPKKYQELLKSRQKPLGTAHAILCAKEKIKEPFAIINADDFYGQDAYQKASQYLDNIQKHHYGLVAYRLGNTLTLNGSAKRGVCEINEKNELIKLTESKVILKNDIVEGEALEDGKKFTTSKNTFTSMNMLLFTQDLFPILEKKIKKFLDNNINNLENCEFLIPIVLNELLVEKQVKVDVLETKAVWYGMTYKEDKELVVDAINEMIKEGTYPKKLWN